MNDTQCSALAARLPKEAQLRRVRAVIDNELTEVERQAIMAYYFFHFTMPEIARMRCVNKSSVCRAIHRAERKLKRYLQY